VPKATVRALLITPGDPIKLWAPPKTGLGSPWAAQGWVLWRWYLPDTGSDHVTVPKLVWQDVKAVSADDPFAIAQALAAAARSASEYP
jgi:hypothetical protein